MIGVIFISASIIACQPESNEASTANQRIGTTSEFNFDLVGEAHNNCLAYIAAHPNFDDLTAEEQYNYGLTYSDPNFETPDMSFEEAVVHFDNAINIAEALINSRASLGDMFYESGHITESMIQYVNAVFQPHIDMADNGYLLEPSEYYAIIGDVKAEITESFPIVYGEIDQTAHEGILLLSLCSVAEYSYEYWYYEKYIPMSSTMGDSNLLLTFKHLTDQVTDPIILVTLTAADYFPGSVAYLKDIKDVKSILAAYGSNYAGQK